MTRPARGRHAAAPDTGRSRRRPPRRLLAAGGLLAVAVLAVPPTAASFRDDAFLQLQDLSSTFQIGTVHIPTGTVHALRPGTAMTLAVAEEARGGYLPGTTAVAPIRVFNNSPHLDAQLDLTVAAAPGTDEALAGAILVSAQALYDDGQTVDLLGTPADPAASTVTLAEATAVLERALTPREADPLADGDAFALGTPGSCVTIHVHLYLAPTPELAGRSSGSPAVTITLGGTST
ncbi:hypothetical protein [Cellulomonas sp. PS-H5]|uniref:hypothetical protein n=1 Tax=Cellulomonas sp. PS-H5 TaxID=2820400 RepID=UPI001C4EF34B|nr:hypothetical protein [Cellulomonas sp. PS-H5]MBW0252647.1 hypothetical protein [Cellulomonas sp. PS-H5]